MRPSSMLARLAAALLLFPFLAAATLAQSDTVTLTSGRQMPGVKVLKDSLDGVAVDRDNDGQADETFKAEEIADIAFGDAPMSYRRGLLAYRSGKYEEAAVEMEAALKEQGVREFWIEQHANYLLADSLRRYAAADPAILARARAAYERIVAKVPDGRLAPEGVHGVGLCDRIAGKPADAQRQFERLTGGKYGAVWAVRGMCSLARALSDQGRHDEAARAAAEARDQAVKSDLKNLVTESNLAAAEILVSAGKHKEALEAYTKIAQECDPRDDTTKARAYNGIGDALLGANRTQDALLAYLRVRVLYFKAEDELPRALYGAARCFTLLKKPDEVRELKDLLKKEHGRSIWALKAQKELGA